MQAPPHFRVLTLLIGFGLVFPQAACSKLLGLGGGDADSGGEAPTTAVEVAPEEPPVTYYLTSGEPLRIAPTEDAKVALNDMPYLVANWRYDLKRGDAFEVVDERMGWFKVVVSNGAEGWVRSEHLLKTEEVTPVTVGVEAQAFDSPLHGNEATRTVKAGTLLFAGTESGDFTLVNVGSGDNVWLRTDVLRAGEEDVGASYMIMEARRLALADDGPGIARLFDKARLRYPDSPLLDVLAEEVPFEEYYEEPVLATSDPQNP